MMTTMTTSERGGEGGGARCEVGFHLVFRPFSRAGGVLLTSCRFSDPRLPNSPQPARQSRLTIGFQFRKVQNDALGETSILSEAVCTVGEALSLMQEVRTRFRHSYRAMLQALSAVGKPTALGTVYDTIPGLGPGEQAALGEFNEVILREAIGAGLPVIDLRLVCDRPADYSHVSPIEPSMVGGAKIVRVIAEVATTHDFGRSQSIIYT